MMIQVKVENSEHSHLTWPIDRLLLAITARRVANKLFAES